MLLVVTGILLFYVLLGAVMDEMSMLLLTIPIFFPMIMALDFGMPKDLTAIWFGIMVLMTVGFGLVAPPVGLNVYIVNGLARDVPMAESYKGVMPFLISDVLRTMLFLFFPIVPLWLVQHGEWQCRQLCAALDPLHADDKPAALDQQLIAAAQMFSDTLGIQPHYLHSYAPVPQSLLFDSALVNDYEHYRQLCATQHREAFEQLLADAGVPRNQAQLREGFAEEEIARFVQEEKIDLLLIGAIARGQLANALIGNTAERVLESVECDLLILKAAVATV